MSQSDPRCAVVTLTRDRLEYTQRMHASLQEFAGTAFDWFVLDQRSDDGTQGWLQSLAGTGFVHTFTLLPENVGINRGLNMLLDLTDGYDVVVNIDNDCELLVPDTLKAAVEVALARPLSVVGPHVQGLRRPPSVTATTSIAGYRVGVTGMIGGLFMPLPRGWRYTVTDALHGDGDSQVSAYAHSRGGLTGYLLDYPVMHMDTTDGQWEKFPRYFARRVAEGGSAS